MENSASTKPYESQRERTALTEALQKLTANWYLDPEKVHEKRRALHKILKHIGQERFEQMIESAIQECTEKNFPATAMLRSYIPLPPQAKEAREREKQQQQMRREWEAGSEEVFSSAECVLAVKLTAKRVLAGERVDHDEIGNEVLAIRELARERGMEVAMPKNIFGSNRK
jgi:hypothetical protein